jgi:hypothetical protein
MLSLSDNAILIAQLPAEGSSLPQSKRREPKTRAGGGNSRHDAALLLAAIRWRFEPAMAAQMV